MAKLIESSGVLNVPLCCDCRHSGHDGFCELIRVSQSFARQSHDRFGCGPWGDRFAPVHDNRED